MTQARAMRSEYMEWAKTASHARYNLASSDLLHYPFEELQCPVRDLEITGPGGYGFAPLREAIGELHGVDPACVVTSIGTSMSNHLAMAAVLGSGDEVLIEEPTYGLLVSTAEYLGAKVGRFPRRPENGFRIVPRDVEKAVSQRTKLIVLTNLHNPSSALADHTTLGQIGEIGRSVGARILVDEVYLDALFEQRPRSSFHLGKEFIVTNSLTKVYGLSGLRCGWILADPDMAARLWRLSDLFYVTSAHMAEIASLVAFRRLPDIARRAKHLLDANTRLLNEFFRRTTRLDWIEHRGGLVAFPRLKPGNADGFCSLLREKHETSVVPGRFFGMPDHFRIGIGGETQSVKTGLQRILAALEEGGTG